MPHEIPRVVCHRSLEIQPSGYEGVRVSLDGKRGVYIREIDPKS